jgi:hypothetical protein
VDQIERRISRLEDKVDVLEQSDKEKGKQRSVNELCKTSGTLKHQIYESQAYKKETIYKLKELKTYSIK